MLTGKKHLAVFSDALVPDHAISEEIIPEQSFKPYVTKGIIKRFERYLSSPKTPFPTLYVCFTTQNNEWRALAFFWAQDECASGSRPYDDAYEFFVGRLLGYAETDIEDYIQNFRHNLRKQSGHKSP